MKKYRKKPPIFRLGSLKKSLWTSILALVVGLAFVTTEYVNEVRSPQTGQPAELYSNQASDDLTQTFVSAINKAKESITLVVYSLTDPDIISCLKAKSQQGVDVKVICDGKASPYVDSKLGANISTIRRYGPGLMHQKILIIDNQETWLGSANMTKESLSLHGNLITAFHDLHFAKAVAQKADTLKVEGKTSPRMHQDFFIGGQKIELWFLPDDKSAVRRLKSLIHSAEKTIRVAMFTWTRQDLAKAIIHAAKRGVQTEVVIDHYSSKGASAKVVQLLKDSGVQVAISPGGSLLHHKFLYIDDSVLAHGSANWTRAAFTQNDDCFIVMHNLTDDQRERMGTLWKTITAEAINP